MKANRAEKLMEKLVARGEIVDHRGGRRTGLQAPASGEKQVRNFQPLDGQCQCLRRGSQCSRNPLIFFNVDVSVSVPHTPVGAEDCSTLRVAAFCSRPPTMKCTRSFRGEAHGRYHLSPPAPARPRAERELHAPIDDGAERYLAALREGLCPGPEPRRPHAFSLSTPQPQPEGD